jgi:hypothetical protein
MSVIVVSTVNELTAALFNVDFISFHSTIRFGTIHRLFPTVCVNFVGTYVVVGGIEQWHPMDHVSHT